MPTLGSNISTLANGLVTKNKSLMLWEQSMQTYIQKHPNYQRRPEKLTPLRLSEPISKIFGKLDFYKVYFPNYSKSSSFCSLSLNLHRLIPLQSLKDLMKYFIKSSTHLMPLKSLHKIGYQETSHYLKNLLSSVL